MAEVLSAMMSDCDSMTVARPIVGSLPNASSWVRPVRSTCWRVRSATADARRPASDSVSVSRGLPDSKDCEDSI